MRSIGATSLVAAVAAVAGLAGSAQAQLDPSLVTGLSSGCASSLVGIVTSSNISSCLSLPSAVGALTSAGNNSVVPGLNQYLSGSICGSGKTACTKAQLSAANSTLLQACGSDIQGSNGGIPALVAYFINSYDRLRTAGCLQDSQGEYCLVKEMYTLQNVTQMPISFSGIQSLLSNQSTQQQSLMALSANKTAFCSDCTHALYSTLFPTNSNAQLAGAVNQTCNSTFLDGKVPSTIKSTANGNSTTASSSTSGSGSGKNAAAGINLGSVAAFGSALAAVAAGLALL